jgi:hypothetical protein
MDDRLLAQLQRIVLDTLEQRRGLVAFSKIEAAEMDRLAREYEQRALERLRGELKELPPKGMVLDLHSRLERMDEQLAALNEQAGIAEASRRLQRDDITWRTFEAVAALLGIGGVAATFLILTAGYRADRLFAFVRAEDDPGGVGFHTLQLLIALGSGGIDGLGLGASRQKFFYIPNAHTDGVFAVLGEELGFIGAACVMLLFALLMVRGFRVILRARDNFGALLAAGIVSWIGYQTIINIGGITRSIPLTGIPLPFLSYGGSALATLLAAVGILLSISRHANGPPAVKREDRRTRTPRASGSRGAR